MLRVLQVVTSMDMGGIEVLLMNIYRNIDRSVVQFDFLVHRQHNMVFEEEILRLGGRIFRVPAVNPLRHFAYLRALRSFFAKHRDYKVIHAHNNAFSMYVLREAKKAGVPVCIAHSHTANVYFSILRSPFYYYCRKRILEFTDFAFACSIEAGQWLFGRTITTNPIFRVVNNGIDCDLFTFSPQLREKARQSLNITNELVIGHVGRFSPEKNHKFLLGVFLSLRMMHPMSVLLLIGEGPLLQDVMGEAQRLGIAESVRFLGTRNDVPYLLQAMDLFVFPSLFEGFAVTLVEAQAAGLACIVSSSVTQEVAVTPLVYFEPLRAGEAHWANTCLRVAGSPVDRQRCSSQVKAAGFHVNDVARWLQVFYSGCMNSLGG